MAKEIEDIHYVVSYNFIMHVIEIILLFGLTVHLWGV